MLETLSTQRIWGNFFNVIKASTKYNKMTSPIANVVSDGE